jgi:hypothetical protein
MGLCLDPGGKSRVITGRHTEEEEKSLHWIKYTNKIDIKTYFEKI